MTCKPKRLPWVVNLSGDWSAATPIGTYEIERDFMAMPSYWWRLVDMDAKATWLDHALELASSGNVYATVDEAKDSAQAHFDAIWREMTDRSK